MINIICLNSLSKFQEIGSINFLIEKEFRSPIKDVKLCSELAPSKELEKFVEHGITDEQLEQLMEIMTLQYETDKACHTISYLKMEDMQSKVINLIRYNDFDEDFSWRSCIRNLLEKYDCLAEVK